MWTAYQKRNDQNWLRNKEIIVIYIFGTLRKLAILDDVLCDQLFIHIVHKISYFLNFLTSFDIFFTFGKCMFRNTVYFKTYIGQGTWNICNLWKNWENVIFYVQYEWRAGRTWRHQVLPIRGVYKNVNDYNFLVP